MAQAGAVFMQKIASSTMVTNQEAETYYTALKVLNWADGYHQEDSQEFMGFVLDQLQAPREIPVQGLL